MSQRSFILFFYLVVHAVTTSFADDFGQLYHIYDNEDGIIVSKKPGTLYQFDDFYYDEQSFDDSPYSLW